MEPTFTYQEGMGLTIYKCPEGGRHELIYRGRVRQEYWCAKCFCVITKTQLKRETD